MILVPWFVVGVQMGPWSCDLATKKRRWSRWCQRVLRVPRKCSVFVVGDYRYPGAEVCAGT